MESGEKKAKKKPRGKAFEKGKSGNPKGRPVGSISNLAKMARESAQDVWPLVVDLAKEMDKDCMKLVVQYGMPKTRGLVDDPESVPARMRDILAAYKDGTISLKDAALELDMNGIPLPESIKILLGKEQPEPVDPSAGVYRSISDEEMEEMVARRKRELAEQVEAIPERRREIDGLRAEVDGTWKNGEGETQ